MKITENLVKPKNQHHGDDRVFLVCDNLDAHCFSVVFDIFAGKNLFVWFCVLVCTDLIQPIDASIGCSLCNYVGHSLDKWLSVDENLEMREGILGTRDRKILMTNCAEAMPIFYFSLHFYLPLPK